MKFTTNFLTLVAASLLMVFTFSSCSDDDSSSTPKGDPENPTTPEVKEMTIAQFAAGNANYSSLVAALTKADLLSVVSDEKANLTVFAPDNAAFTKFLSDAGTTLEAIDKDALKQVLLNHVIGSEIKAATIISNESGYEKNEASGPDGSKLNTYYRVVDGKVMINGGVEVAAPDAFDASNGIIHAVKDVIGLPTVVTFATADPTFSILVQALTREASFTYVSTLSSNDPENDASPFTVFAPTDAAFGSLLTELGVAGLADIPTATLEATLNTHVVANANVLAGTLTNDMPVTTLGAGLTVKLDPARLVDGRDREANIIVTDVQAANGVIHVIDKVVLPPVPKATLEAK